jgi:hypothetical protein
MDRQANCRPFPQRATRGDSSARHGATVSKRNILKRGPLRFGFLCVSGCRKKQETHSGKALSHLQTTPPNAGKKECVPVLLAAVAACSVRLLLLQPCSLSSYPLLLLDPQPSPPTLLTPVAFLEPPCPASKNHPTTKAPTRKLEKRSTLQEGGACVHTTMHVRAFNVTGVPSRGGYPMGRRCARPCTVCGCTAMSHTRSARRQH